MGRLVAAFPPLLLTLAIAGLLFFIAEPIVGSDLHPLFRWLLAAGGITFACYGFDKARSKGKGRRISEWTLHGLALAGGVFGGWLGMFLFRHKTQKPIFRLILLGATALWGWLLWP